MFRFGFIALLLLPLYAAGAMAAETPAVGAPQVTTGSADQARVQTASSDDLRGWNLLDDQWQDTFLRGPQSVDFQGLGLTSRSGSGIDYLFTSGWHARALIDQRSWHGVGSTGSCLAANPAVRRAGCQMPGMAPGLVYSQIGAGFDGSGFSLDLNLSASRPAPRSPLLPRVLPSDSNLSATVNGLPFDLLQSGTSVHAHGRVALWGDKGLDIGASLGRIRLLPNNLLGVQTYGQKSLSLGMDSGPISGRIVGRLIQPEQGMATDMLGPEHRWTSIDLGVTWRLPWQGSLSFGAQNVWTSGNAPQPKAGTANEPSSIPYVQYHQDF